jgi:hypothetical protein
MTVTRGILAFVIIVEALTFFFFGFLHSGVRLYSIGTDKKRYHFYSGPDRRFNLGADRTPALHKT